jgi:hypothetical protein
MSTGFTRLSVGTARTALLELRDLGFSPALKSEDSSVSNPACLITPAVSLRVR